MQLHFPAGYWHRNDSDKLECELCPHHCKLAEGQRGICFVRQRIGNEIILTTYGKSSGFCIDPIEKKPLHHFYPGSPVLSFGTAGCNLKCKFCQNWDISHAKAFDRLTEQASPQKIAKVSAEKGCKSVAFTYNDPVIFLEYARDTAIACKQKELKTVAVTAGYAEGQARKDFFEWMDAANVDLKAFSDSFYQQMTGGDLKTVLDTLVYIREKTGIWLEITTLIIPGKNDDPQEIKKMSAWVKANLGPDTPLHFSAFHPDHKMRDWISTPLTTLIQCREIALAEGLQHIYLGNVHYPEADATYCSHCGKAVIQRDWYEILDYQLDESGKCRYCGEKVSGRYDTASGNWGSKRQPVQIG